MVLFSITEEQIRKIVQDANRSSEEKITVLTQQFQDYVKKTHEFRRKLESAISQIRESNGTIADKLDELIRDWNEL